MDYKNKNKTIYYYAIGAITLLLALKLFSSKFFENLIDFVITFLPFIIVFSVIAAGVVRYRKNPYDIEVIKKKVLSNTLYLLLITLAFYILYSPKSFVPIFVSVKKFGQLFSMENYFLVLSYISVFIFAFSVIYLFIRIYQKSQGTFKGSITETFHNTLYSVFFIFAFLFVSSLITFPKAYSPVTKYVSNALYYLFLEHDDQTRSDNLGNVRINSVKTVLSNTFQNLKDNVGKSNEKLIITLNDNKTTLDRAISRTNDDLKDKLSDDIEDRLDITGGTLSGDLTIEDELEVEDTSTMQDIIPSSDDTYDLGSITKGWDNVYVHSLHGSSIITIGDSLTSHGITDSDDLLISGDLEVNGMTYLDGGLNGGGNKITNVADPTDPQDVVTKAHMDANLGAAGVFENVSNTLSPIDSLAITAIDAENAVINNIGVAGTDFTGTGGLTLAGVLTASSASAHTLGSLGVTAGAVTGVTSLTMTAGILSGVTTGTIGTANVTTLDLGTNTINDGNLTGDWAGLTSLTVDNININGNTINATSGDLTITAAGGDIDFGNEDLTTTGSLTAGQTILSGGLDMNNNTIYEVGTLTINDPGDNEGFSWSGTAAKIFVSPLNSGNSDGYLRLINDGGIVFEAGAEDTETMILTAAGTVGIGGEITPASLLEIYDTDADTILTLTNTHATDYDPMIQYRTDGTPTVKFSVGVDSNSNEFKIFSGDVTDTSVLTNGFADAEEFVIDSSGTTYISDLEIGASSFETNAGVLSWMDLPQSSTANQSGTVHSYSAQIDGTSVLTVYAQADGSGDLLDDYTGVGLGTAAPGAMLHVYDDKATDYAAEFYNDGDNANRYGLFIQAGADSGAGTLIQFGDGDGTDVGEITFSGTTTTYSTSSDVRMKSNIRETEKGLADLMQINVHDFEFNEEYGDSSTYTGFIAQEIIDIMPEAVSYYDDDDGRMWGVDYGRITPIIVRSVQNQQGQIEEVAANFEDLGITVGEDTASLTQFQLETNDHLALLDGSVVDNVLALAELEEKVNGIDLDSQVELITEIQDQMDIIQEQYNALTDSIIAMNLDNLIYKDASGNVDLLDGVLVAEEVDVNGIKTGEIVIKVTEGEDATIGEAVICLEDTLYDGDTKECLESENENRSDGKSVVVETKAASNDSKIFVTPKVTTEQPLAVTEITDGESFKVEVVESVADDTSFDWWIVGVKSREE